jgi:hypothetical protein
MYELGYRFVTATDTDTPRDVFRPIFESPDGNYYVADTGNVLHRFRNCSFLHTSANIIHDPTRTLTYRMLRGDPICNSYGNRVLWTCINCYAARRETVPPTDTIYVNVKADVRAPLPVL